MLCSGYICLFVTRSDLFLSQINFKQTPARTRSLRKYTYIFSYSAAKANLIILGICLDSVSAQLQDIGFFTLDIVEVEY